MLRITNLLLLFSCCNFAAAQISSDSLNSKSFDYLFNEFELSNSFKAQDIYASAIISKAKNDKDTIRLVAGYSFKSQIHQDLLHLTYLDSIILISKLKSNKYQPAIAYLNKGSFYYNKGNYDKSLENVIVALGYTKTNSNKDLEIECNQKIATLKTRLGESDEALPIFKENLKYYQEAISNTDIYTTDRLNILKLNSIHSIAIAYKDLNQFDSTSYYNRLGLKKSIEYDNPKYENYFRFNEGVNLYKNAFFTEALDSLTKSINFLNRTDDRANQAIVNFYIAKIYDKRLNSKQAIKYFKKVDSIFRISNDIYPNLRETYEKLIRYYEVIGDNKNQLDYVLQLIKIDSILHQNELYLNKEIIKEYDIPNLVSNKERIISVLERKNKDKIMYLYWFWGIFLVLLFAFSYQYNRRRIYKKRFENIINDQKSNEQENLDIDVIPKDINISEELVKQIQLGLKNFEKQKRYLDQDLTLQDVAKEINTNTSYLSRVVNYYKKESFTHYLNNLRVEFALKELRSNEVFRKYNLKAIANEVGFKKSESFSRAFYKKIGVKPAFFLKQLIELEKK